MTGRHILKQASLIQFKTNQVSKNWFLTLAHRVPSPCQEEPTPQVEDKIPNLFQKATWISLLPLPGLIRSRTTTSAWLTGVGRPCFAKKLVVSESLRSLFRVSPTQLYLLGFMSSSLTQCFPHWLIMWTKWNVCDSVFKITAKLYAVVISPDSSGPC